MLPLMGSVWAPVTHTVVTHTLFTHTSCRHLCREKYSMCVMLHTEVLVLSVNEVSF
jgi:hypothetical protein